MAADSSEAEIPPAGAAASPFEALFNRRIEFHPAKNPYSPISSAGIDFHLETLNPSSDHQRPQPSAGVTTAPTPGKRSDGGKVYEHGFDPELGFSITFRRIGAGLANLGNTCFLNSVLQCLTYTEPFAAYLQSGKHKSSCHIAGFCTMCALQNHVMSALQSTGKILSPFHLVKNLRCVSRSFRNSRQEDAHEYMVNLLESMHKCCLPSGIPSESPSAYEKSLVHKIFGGRLRSQVKCVECCYFSNKFDPFLDLSLEIVKADTLLKALSHFTAIEQLDGGESQYQCQRCKEKVRARKQLTIHKAPYVLTIHLKRFCADVPGEKIDKKVEFEPTLDLKPFVSNPQDEDLTYTLYGVLVHAGWNIHSGHYYCFVRTSSGMWHSLDDNQVIQVSEKSVLAQKAYMLFYVRDRSPTVKRSVFVYKDCVMERKLSASEDPTKMAVSNPMMVPEGLAQLIEPNDDTATTATTSSGHDASTHENIQITLGSHDLPNGCNAEVKLGIPAVQTNNSDFPSSTFEKLTENLMDANGDATNDIIRYNVTPLKMTSELTENIMDANGDATNDMIQYNVTPLKMTSDNITAKSERRKFSSQLSPTNGSPKKRHELRNEKCSSKKQFQNGGERVEKEVTIVPMEDSVRNHYGKGPKQKKLEKCSFAKSLYFGRGQLFLSKISLRKNKKHKGSKKRCTSSRKRRNEDDVDPTKNDTGASISKGIRINDGDSKHRQIKCLHSSANSEINISGVNDVTYIGCDSTNTKDKDKRMRSDENGPVSVSVEHLRRSSNSALDECNTAGPNVCTELQSQHDVMNLLMRGLNKTTVGQWDDIESQTTQIHSVDNLRIDNIGYVLNERDEEYDQGRRKKVKKQRVGPFGGSNSNPFQEAANEKARERMKQVLDQTSSGNQPIRI